MKTIVFGDCVADQHLRLSDPDEPSESEFEHTVARALSCLYKNYQCIVFGGSFRLEERTHKPDLALVAHDRSHWYVIEVELLSHSLHGHVLPQVRAFRYGTPGEDCIPILARELGIERSRAETFLLFVPRTVAVVANKHSAEWEIGLEALGASFLTVSRFTAKDGREAMEVDGSLAVVKEHLGFGTYIATDRSLRLAATVRIPDGAVQLEDSSGAPAMWIVVRQGGHAWVRKQYGNPAIEDGAVVQLQRTVDGRFVMRVASQ